MDSSGGAVPERRTKQKRDPAWNYCELSKNEDTGKRELHCAFCGKVFKGGGIHRVKEHLAGAKGDGGSPCLNVDPDVRALMQENLRGIMGKRSKKQRFVSVNEIPDQYNPNDALDSIDDAIVIAEDSVKPYEMIDIPMDFLEGKPSEVQDVGSLEPVPIGSYKRDPAWRFCKMYKIGEKSVLQCLYCEKRFYGGGIYRLKEHLAGRTGNGAVCPKVTRDVRLTMQQNLNANTSAGKQNKILKPYVDASNNNAEVVHRLTNGHDLNNDMDLSNDKNVGVVYPRSGNNQVQMAIGRFMLYAGVPFDAVNSVHFQRMTEAIASQKYHVVPPSSNDLRSWILESAVKEVKCDVDRFTGCWGRTGCSILVDEWITGKGRILLNVLVNCLEGPLFFKSIDISSISDSVDDLYQVLANVTEEVGVSNVLQVITSSEERYIEIGEKLKKVYPIFWTPCASHCVSLILEDFRRLDWISALLEQCQSITRFIYNEPVVLNMMRKHTLGVDLVDIGATRPATDFMTLNRMVRIKQNLQTMVASEDWTENTYSKEEEGLALFECFTNESFWDSCALVTRLAEPFLRLLRIVSSEKRPAMGYVYGGIYKAKETIKKELINQQDYAVYWDIIDQRWEQLQHHPLVAAGFYLNPKFFYSIGAEVPHIKSLLFDCVEKLVPDPDVQDEIVKETLAYKNGEGDFGRKMAVRARDTYLPADWWSSYGGACPNLTSFAQRVLSQTCSLVSSKPSHINLGQNHEAVNCLEQERLSNLISVQYNWWLRERFSKNKTQEPLDPLMFTDSKIAGCWLKDESHSNIPSAHDWSPVSPPSGNILLLGSQADDYEALGAGFDDLEVFNARKYIEPAS